MLEARAAGDQDQLTRALATITTRRFSTTEFDRMLAGCLPAVHQHPLMILEDVQILAALATAELRSGLVVLGGSAEAQKSPSVGCGRGSIPVSPGVSAELKRLLSSDDRPPTYRVYAADLASRCELGWPDLVGTYRTAIESLERQPGREFNGGLVTVSLARACCARPAMLWEAWPADEAAQVPLVVAIGLLGVRAGEAEPVLRRARASGLPELRNEAVLASSLVRGHDGVGFIRELLRGEQQETRVAAAHAAAAWGPEARDLTADLLLVARESSGELRLAVLVAIGEVCDASAPEPRLLLLELPAEPGTVEDQCAISGVVSLAERSGNPTRYVRELSDLAGANGSRRRVVAVQEAIGKRRALQFP